MKFNRNDENYVYGFIGKNIQKYRKQRGLTQAELAELTTYSKQFISNIENNVFSVAIIPHTLENTTLKNLKIGDLLN